MGLAVSLAVRFDCPSVLSASRWLLGCREVIAVTYVKKVRYICKWNGYSVHVDYVRGKIE